jgi:hypothetical protein
MKKILPEAILSLAAVAVLISIVWVNRPVQPEPEAPLKCVEWHAYEQEDVGLGTTTTFHTCARYEREQS